MLGYKAEESLFKSYPVIKLADFGLAELTGPDDPWNPKRLHGRGSAAYMPPVSRTFQSLGSALKANPAVQ